LLGGAGDCRPGVFHDSTEIPRGSHDSTEIPVESQWNLGFGVGTCIPNWKDSRRKALDMRPDIKSVMYISMRSSGSSGSSGRNRVH
jgi:hypothetical protein